MNPPYSGGFFLSQILPLNFNEVPEVQKNIRHLQGIKGPFECFSIKGMPQENRYRKNEQNHHRNRHLYNFCRLLQRN